LPVCLGDDSLELACNVHNELLNRENPNRITLVAARPFFDDRTEAKSLAHRYCGALLHNATHDS
jgi:hypothetical protein